MTNALLEPELDDVVEDLPTALVAAAMNANCSDARIVLTAAKWIQSVEELVRDYLDADEAAATATRFNPALMETMARLDALRRALAFTVRWHSTGTKAEL